METDRRITRRRALEILASGVLGGGIGSLVFSGIGAAAPPTGSIMGSLTTPRIPYASAATVLADSELQYDANGHALNPTSDNAVNLGSPSLHWNQGFFNFLNLTGSFQPTIRMRSNQIEDRYAIIGESLVSDTIRRPIFVIQDGGSDNTGPFISLVSVNLDPSQYGFAVGSGSESSLRSFNVQAFRNGVDEIAFTDPASVNILSMDSGNRRVAIGTQNPTHALDVDGTVGIRDGGKLRLSFDVSPSSCWFFDSSSRSTRLRNDSETDLLRIDNSTGNLVPYSSVVPNSDNSQDLGTSSKRWQSLYAQNLVSDFSSGLNLYGHIIPSADNTRQEVEESLHFERRHHQDCSDSRHDQPNPHGKVSADRGEWVNLLCSIVSVKRLPFL